MADAIAYLHSKEVIHGDIKAANALVSRDHHVQLCDFGLSKLNYMITSEGMKGVGTARWQSPEVMHGDSKSEKSDVYAFGISTLR